MSLRWPSERAVLTGVLCLFLVSPGCDRDGSTSSTPAPESSRGGDESTEPEWASWEAGPTYRELCAYEVSNEAGTVNVRGTLKRDEEGRIETLRITHFSEETVQERLRYEVTERDGRSVTFDRFQGDETERSGVTVLERLEGHNLAVRLEGDDRASASPQVVSVYSESPLEILAAGPSFPVGRKVNRENYEFGESGRLRRASVDHDDDGSKDADVFVEYTNGLIERIRLAGKQRTGAYLRATYETGQLESVAVDEEIDGIVNEVLTTSYDCTETDEADTN